MWRNVQLLNEPKTKWNSTLLERGYCWLVRGKLLGHADQIVGVDPGVNFGITVIDKEDVYIYNGKLLTQENRIEYAFLAMNLIAQLVYDHGVGRATFILEGAAFSKQFGQVNLAEVRAGYYIGMRQFNVPKVSPPMSIRKKVFGDGRQQAADLFPQLNHNASDSLAIALYGMD